MKKIFISIALSVILIFTGCKTPEKITTTTDQNGTEELGTFIPESNPSENVSTQGESIKKILSINEAEIIFSTTKGLKKYNLQKKIVENTSDEISKETDDNLPELVQITNCKDEGTCSLKIANKTIDYVRECKQIIFSPNKKYLAYTDFPSRGQEILSIYNTGTGVTTQTQESVGNRINIISWSNENTLIFVRDIYENETRSKSIWSYDTETQTVKQISAKISTNENQNVSEEMIISQDFKKVAFIKTFSDSLLQELWLANADGSDARIIYKNYE